MKNKETFSTLGWGVVEGEIIGIIMVVIKRTFKQALRAMRERMKTKSVQQKEAILVLSFTVQTIGQEGLPREPIRIQVIHKTKHISRHRGSSSSFLYLSSQGLL